MSDTKTDINTIQIQKLLDSNRPKMKLSLGVCARCTLCAESCFLFKGHQGDPAYMPSHKVINSVGRLYKNQKRIDRAMLEDVRDIVWGKCALCTRCYCPFGIDIPSMIAFGRSICRSQGVYPDFEQLAS